MSDASNCNKELIKYESFLKYLLEWRDSLKSLSLRELVERAGDSKAVGVACVDLVKGFASEGNLSSPRVAAIVPRVADLLERIYGYGVRDYVIIQDAHPDDSLEFEVYGPHCRVGSSEAEMVDELASLPFADQFDVVPKSTTNAFVGTNLQGWLDARPQLKTLVVVGDCTDICVYQLAIHLRAKCVAESRRLEIVVPEDCVQTYDLPVQTARSKGLMAHDGDFFHLVFLYHMALNGVNVVSSLV
ncbi:MAG: isochorismatase family cysteine hydrolase [Armatimonadota bacterium]|nr:isochorismatase family cysteine hydrolase [Armatimonadota bacterium]